MLKIFFSLLICVLGYSSSLDSSIIHKKDLGEDIRLDLSIVNEDLHVKSSIGTLKIFPEYKEDVMLSKLRNSLLYVLVPIHKSSEYIWDSVNSISKATKELPEGCIVYPIFRIDDDELDRECDIKSLKKALKDAQIPEGAYDISYNPKNIGEDLTRQALLDTVTEIDDQKYKDANRSRYFTFLDSDDVINKSAFKVFLAVAFLNKDKWVFDFEHCIRRFNEANKQAVVLDTNLYPKDLCYKYYNMEVLTDANTSHPVNFNKQGFLRADISNVICGYCPALYKYDKVRIISCKSALEDHTLEHFSPAYADKKNLNKIGTVADYERPKDRMITEGYFKVFLKGFDNLTGEDREKKGALYYYREYYKIPSPYDGSAVERRQNENSSDFLEDNTAKRYRQNEDSSNKN